MASGSRLVRALNASPIVLAGKSFTLVWFGVYAAVAAFAGGLVLTCALAAMGETGVLADVAVLAVATGNWIGARAFHLVALGSKFLRRPGKYLGETGFYVQGGILGATATAAALASRLHAPVGAVLDALAVGGLATLAIGRVGCFNYGCCYGRATSRPWGVAYCHAQSKVLRLKPHYHGVPLHPTQLYLAGANAVALAFAATALARPLPAGAIAAAFLVYHGALRLLVETVRDDVRFDDGRNWLTVKVAAATLATGVAAVALHAAVPGGLFGAPRAAIALGPRELVAFAFGHPRAVLACLGAGVVMLAGYGLHGERLGTFAGVRR